MTRLRILTQRQNNKNLWKTLTKDCKVKFNTEWCNQIGLASLYDTDFWNRRKRELIDAGLENEIAIVRSAQYDTEGGSDAMVAAIEFTRQSGIHEVPPVWLEPIADTFNVSKEAKPIRVEIKLLSIGLPPLGSVMGHIPSSVSIRTKLFDKTMQKIGVGDVCFMFQSSIHEKRVKIKQIIDKNTVEVEGSNLKVNVKSLIASPSRGMIFMFDV